MNVPDADNINRSKSDEKLKEDTPEKKRTVHLWSFIAFILIIVICYPGWQRNGVFTRIMKKILGIRIIDEDELKDLERKKGILIELQLRSAIVVSHYAEIKNQIENQNCSICSYPYIEKKRVAMITDCRHAFHMRCFRESIDIELNIEEIRCIRCDKMIYNEEKVIESG